MALICFISCNNYNDVLAYDFNAEHKVNLYHDNAEEIAKIQKMLWGEFREWGMTEAGCAGVLANMMAESGCDYTRTQGNVIWGKFRKGITGIGLTQWSYISRQEELFSIADELGKQWNTLEVQAKQLKNEITEGGKYYIPELYNSNSINTCTDRFLEVYEKPRVLNYNTRRNMAKSIHENLKGTPPKNIGSSGSEEGEIENTDVSEQHITSVIEEFELVGMNSFKYKISDKQSDIILATRDDLDIGEQYSVSLIGSDISLRDKAISVDNVRIMIVFLGMCLIFYSVVLGVSVLFDRANNFIDISLIKIISFGLLTYSDEIDTKKKKGFASTGKIIFIIVILVIVGCVLISGGVMPFMCKSLEWVVDNFNKIK